jgi:glycosyltransferase 2 family protein
MNEHATPAPHPARRFFITAAKVIVSAGLLWLLLSRVDLSRLWTYARHASIGWLVAALALYLVMLLLSAWRWDLLLNAQGCSVPGGRLVNSYLVATFFNNFLPSNIGGDVIRIRDTAAEVGSKTTATTIVLVDRGIGLLGLFLVAAVAATADAASGGGIPMAAPLLWLGFVIGTAAAIPMVRWPSAVSTLLGPLRRIHQEWVTERIARMTRTLERFGQAPKALAWCFGGAILVQLVLVAFYVAIARSMAVPVSPWHLAVLIPLSFIVQMAPISLNGLGVREAVFTYYFSRISLPPESALAVSFMGAVLIMLFSLSGAAAMLVRGTTASGWNASLADGADD